MSNSAAQQHRRLLLLPGRRPQPFLLAAGVLFIWLLGWVWLSWPYTLDDALIHLRYADHLLHQHRITYDGVHNSFGTSSLLYVSLLAVGRSIWTSSLLPRCVSSITYVLLFLGLALMLSRNLRAEPVRRLSALMAVALLAVMVEPSAARWLNDGMETGLVFADTLLAVLLLQALLRAKAFSPWLALGAFTYGLLTVLLRIELLLLVGCVSLMAGSEALLREAVRKASALRGSRLVLAFMPVAGGLVAVSLVELTMHALLPDTALAKAFGAASWRQTLSMSEITIVSSFSFGMGLILLWIISLGALLASCRFCFADFCANALFPVVLVLSAVRGQQIQGIRYFGWTVFFPLLWNWLRFTAAPKQLRPWMRRMLTWGTVVILCALVPAAALEGRTFYRLFQGRGIALNTFRHQDLTALRGQLGIAEDVGFVGYFTQGDICDPYGLINGRALARLKYQQRLDRCVAHHPVFLFGSPVFLQRVEWEMDFAGWFVCGRYPFDNVRTSDVHYLVVAPADARATCASTAEPVTQVLPALFSAQH